MSRTPIALALTLALLATGCASKKDLESARAELAACRQEAADLEASVGAWEERFDRESNRWAELESSVSEALPRALNEFQAKAQKLGEVLYKEAQAKQGDEAGTPTPPEGEGEKSGDEPVDADFEVKA